MALFFSGTAKSGKLRPLLKHTTFRRYHDYDNHDFCIFNPSFFLILPIPVFMVASFLISPIGVMNDAAANSVWYSSFPSLPTKTSTKAEQLFPMSTEVTLEEEDILMTTEACFSPGSPHLHFLAAGEAVEDDEARRRFSALKVGSSEVKETTWDKGINGMMTKERDGDNGQWTRKG